MRRRVGRGAGPGLVVAAAFTVSVAAVAHGCSATGTRPPAGTGGAASAGQSSSSAGTGGAKASSSTSGSTGGDSGAGGGTGGGMLVLPDAGDAGGDAGEAGCGSQCGPVELCDPAHLGLDDNCNGEVDEGCPCNPGELHWCFAGDPKYHGVPGCYDGTEACTELGTWGPCIGGVQAWPPDNCYENDTASCHAISALPFATVDLATGTGSFSANAVPGSESYTVECPTGVPQCPAVVPPSSFQPLQSGQYTVTYTKSIAGDAGPLSCTFPLFVGAPGLRIELSWEHFTTDNGVDLDLHVHQPQNIGPWTISPGAPQDCGWANCKIKSFQPPQDPSSPTWFPLANMVPQPVDWDDQPNPAANTCYDIPHSVGMVWQMVGKGCHNPRLDIDDVQCNLAVTDPNDSMFCTPENINVDYPPTYQWFRIAVHYYWNHGQTYDVHPEVKVFYDGEQFADLGPQGYYVPAAPVTFPASQGANEGYGNLFWLVADVAVVDDGCGGLTGVVQPLYDDATSLTPYFMDDVTATTQGFFPPWPPPPQ